MQHSIKPQATDPAVAAYLARGGNVTVCPPGRANAPATSPFRDNSRATDARHLAAVLGISPAALERERIKRMQLLQRQRATLIAALRAARLGG